MCVVGLVVPIAAAETSQLQSLNCGGEQIQGVQLFFAPLQLDLEHTSMCLLVCSCIVLVKIKGPISP